MTDKLKNAGLDVLTLALSGVLVSLGETATDDLGTNLQLAVTGALFVFLKSLNGKDGSYGLTGK